MEEKKKITCQRNIGKLYITIFSCIYMYLYVIPAKSNHTHSKKYIIAMKMCECTYEIFTKSMYTSGICVYTYAVHFRGAK